METSSLGLMYLFVCLFNYLFTFASSKETPRLSCSPRRKHFIKISDLVSFALIDVFKEDGPTRSTKFRTLDFSRNWPAKFKEFHYYVFKEKIQKQIFRKIGQANSKKKKKRKEKLILERNS